MGHMTHPPFKLEGLDHVVLLVRGMAEAQHFYEQVLGCSVDRALPQYGMLQLRAGASLIDLVDIGSTEGEWARPDAWTAPDGCTDQPRSRPVGGVPTGRAHDR